MQTLNKSRGESLHSRMALKNSEVVSQNQREGTLQEMNIKPIPLAPGLHPELPRVERCLTPAPVPLNDIHPRLPLE